MAFCMNLILNSEKEAIKIFIKKFADKDPHVISHSFTVKYKKKLLYK